MQDFWNSENHERYAFDPHYYAPSYKKVKKLTLDALGGFDFLIRYVETPPDAQEPLLTHKHAQYEIYVNCSGDVSFMVEGGIFPISSGNALILRPNVLHHCIYNTRCQHRHYWILFSPNDDGSVLEELFGDGEILTALDTEQKIRLLTLCERLSSEEFTPFRRYAAFFELLDLLTRQKNRTKREHVLKDVRIAMAYIHEHLSEPICVEGIARHASVSVNTLERHFSACLGITPMAYVKQQRLLRAAALLECEYTLSDIALECGFCDSSHLITLFKSHYGITPSKYRKQYFKSK